MQGIICCIAVSQRPMPKLMAHGVSNHLSKITAGKDLLITDG